MKKFIIDRIEEKTAILEDDNGCMIKVDVQLLPSETKEGCVLSYSNDVFILEVELTESRRKLIFDKFKNLH